jgi:hypothetical protein
VFHLPHFWFLLIHVIVIFITINEPIWSRELQLIVCTVTKVHVLFGFLSDLFCPRVTPSTPHLLIRTFCYPSVSLGCASFSDFLVFDDLADSDWSNTLSDVLLLGSA